MNFVDRIKQLKEASKQVSDKNKLAGNTWYLDSRSIIAYPRADGDSRYPYGNDGFNLWAYASGYMYAAESTFNAFNFVQEGAEPNICFFAGFPQEDGTFRPLSLTGVPIDLYEDAKRFTVFMPKAVYYFTTYNNIEFCVRVFVDADKVVHFSVNASNKTGSPARLYLSAYMYPYIMYGYTDDPNMRWWRTCRMVEGSGLKLPPFIEETTQDISRTEKICNYGIIARKLSITAEKSEATASRRRYTGGKSNSLSSSRPLKYGTFGDTCHFCTFTDVAAFGDINHIIIPANESVRYDVSFTVAHDLKNAERLAAVEVSAEAADRLLEALEKKEQDGNSSMSISCGEFKNMDISKECFNNFMEFVKRQVEYCALGKSYAGPLLGVRDVFQQIEAALLWQPESCAAKILDALSFTAPNGRCPRQFSYPAGNEAPMMDLRPFIDQGVWVITTIITYLRATKDFNFLNKECGYYEIINQKAGQVKKSDIHDSVLEHMIRIMNYLVDNRDMDYTKCVRALFGDWNDALDGLGVSSDPNTEYGTGVSVMATLQVYQNLNEMIELLSIMDKEKYSAEIQCYISARDEIRDGLFKYVVVEENGKKKIIHGWGDKRSYLVGSFRDVDGKARTGLASNAFWVLSGLYDLAPDIKDTILTAFEKLDSKYGLMTFDVPFAVDAPGVGRITNLPEGTAENAAAYIHASMFGIAALFRMGEPEAAWKQVYKSLPITHSFISTSPFIMPNSYCYNPQKNIDGQSMNDWHTGSGTVLIKTMVRYAFGFEPQFGGIWIQPAGYLPFDEFTFKVNVRGCDITIEYRNKNKGKRTFTVNGEAKAAVYDDLMGIDKLWVDDSEIKESVAILVED